MGAKPFDQADHRLTLADELLLVAIRPDGSVPVAAAARLDRGIAAAVLLELTLRGQIELTDGELTLSRARHWTGDELLERALQQISESADRGYGVKGWLTQLWPGACRWRDRIAGRLVESGILRESTRRRLPWRRPRVRLVDHLTRDAACERVRGVLLTDAPADERTTLLAGLAYACNLTRVLVPRGQRRPARRRGKTLASENWAPHTVIQTAFDDVQAGLMQMVQEVRLDLDLGGGLGGGGFGGDGGGGHGGHGHIAF